MAHCGLLNGKEETLLCITNINAVLLAQFCDFMDESVEQRIKAQATSYERNRCLFEWVRQCSSEAFKAFIQALRVHDQEHVANYIEETRGKYEILVLKLLFYNKHKINAIRMV